MRARRALALLLAALSMAGVARADTDPDGNEARARAHFEAGATHYSRGDYQAAEREFAAGYHLARRPQFLVNLGQVYRRLGKLERAREMYQRFLDEAASDDLARPQVRALRDEVEALERQQRKRRPSELEATPPPPPPVEAVAAPATTEQAAPRAEAGLVVAAAPAHEQSFWRRYFWVVPVGAVVAALAVVGIYFAAVPRNPGPDCSGAQLGCLDLRH
jgi:tetratricopeptide (TPR) repeat protein